MKIKRMFVSCGFPYHYVIEMLDGTFKKIRVVPFRPVQESDLQPLKMYIAKGNKAEEVPDYVLKINGLEKAD